MPDLQQAATERSAAVSIVAVLPADASVTGEDSNGRMSAESYLFLINAGPLPVEVTSLDTRLPGQTITASDSRTLRPGGQIPLNVSIQATCTTLPDLSSDVRVRSDFAREK